MSLKFRWKNCFSKEHKRIYYIIFGEFINWLEIWIFLSVLREIQLSAEQKKKKKNPDAKLPEWSKSTAKEEEIETYVLNVFISFYKFSHVINSAHLSGMKK